jgi:hypothetical protein
VSEIKLSREVYDQLKRDERKLLDLLPQCDRLDACQIDTGSYRGVIQSLLDNISQLENQFANPPPK